EICHEARTKMLFAGKSIRIDRLQGLAPAQRKQAQRQHIAAQAFERGQREDRGKVGDSREVVKLEILYRRVLQGSEVGNAGACEVESFQWHSTDRVDFFHRPDEIEYPQ